METSHKDVMMKRFKCGNGEGIYLASIDDATGAPTSLISLATGAPAIPNSTAGAAAPAAPAH